MGEHGSDNGPQLGIGSDFERQTRQELKRLEMRMAELDDSLSKLRRERQQVAEAVIHLRGLLQIEETASHMRPRSMELDSTMGAPLLAMPSPSRAQGPSRRESDADLVVEYLREVGKPLHYRQIYDGLHKRGLDVGGKDPANTLLSRYFNDPRLERVGRGTYALKS